MRVVELGGEGGAGGEGVEGGVAGVRGVDGGEGEGEAGVGVEVRVENGVGSGGRHGDVGKGAGRGMVEWALREKIEVLASARGNKLN